ncbi:hypothetical protein HYFRA_00008101 [Hymenoscyphus fraxineus]|uniref:Uncharacterized protein n=1 Tax=Hymenoscyphus fraxineus TaxID=746836 RepID=A0A9N9L786_9HELO|nr:hypothetical protein HYFRA_00008101 [Hymenoscyphus fraxineus]
MFPPEKSISSPHSPTLHYFTYYSTSNHSTIANMRVAQEGLRDAETIVGPQTIHTLSTATEDLSHPATQIAKLLALFRTRSSIPSAAQALATELEGETDNVIQELGLSKHSP